jgi:hypothetical protein
MTDALERMEQSGMASVQVGENGPELVVKIGKLYGTNRIEVEALVKSLQREAREYPRLRSRLRRWAQRLLV